MTKTMKEVLSAFDERLINYLEEKNITELRTSTHEFDRIINIIIRRVDTPHGMTQFRHQLKFLCKLLGYELNMIDCEYLAYTADVTYRITKYNQKIGGLTISAGKLARIKTIYTGHDYYNTLKEELVEKSSDNYTATEINIILSDLVIEPHIAYCFDNEDNLVYIVTEEDIRELEDTKNDA